MPSTRATNDDFRAKAQQLLAAGLTQALRRADGRASVALDPTCTDPVRLLANAR